MVRTLTSWSAEVKRDVENEPMRRSSATATEILDTAQQLVQTRGFNGFSYADVASVVGTTKATVHYHFASKGDLGVALIRRYAADFTAALHGIDGRGDAAIARLAAYAALYRGVLADGRLCLCGMLATEHETLPEPMADVVTQFFDDNLAWLERTVADGATDGTVRVDGSPRDAAGMVLGALEGAMLVAWSRRDVELFDRATRELLRAVGRHE
jgi:TetR/AcrR family transcriptional regulator, transcriptional repressor for nem operon